MNILKIVQNWHQRKFLRTCGSDQDCTKPGMQKFVEISFIQIQTAAENNL